MERERKTDAQDRDALLREILDDTERSTSKPTQPTQPVQPVQSAQPTPPPQQRQTVSHAAAEPSAAFHAAPQPVVAPAPAALVTEPIPEAETEWQTQAFHANATAGQHVAAPKTYSATETSQLYEDLDGISQQEAVAPKKKKVKKKKRKKRRVASALVITLTILVVSIGISATVMTLGQDLLGINNDTKTRLVNIPTGANTAEIAEILKEEGIISHPKLFTFFAGMSDKDSEFTAGEHEVRPDMAYETLFEELASPAMNASGTVQIAFPEGITLREAADLLESTNVCDADDFIDFFNDHSQYGYTYESHLPSFVNEKFYVMEGYLFPDTYIFYEDMDVDLVCQKILENFDSKITQEYYDRMDELGITLDQMLTLASMIQSEAGTVDQMSKISSVFWNRLNNPTEYPKLQSDPTSDYVEEVIKPNIKTADPDLYTAYDTYESEGLPPGAICNPGLDAIRAALYPADTDYYYFYSNLDTRETYFSRTLQEHEAVIDKVERSRQTVVTSESGSQTTTTKVVMGVGTSVSTELPTDENGLPLETTTETDDQVEDEEE
jgi:UPF0755 protein